MYKYKNAVEDFDKALELDPKYMLAYNERGLAKDAMGVYDGALQDYLEALKFKVFQLRIYGTVH